MFWLKIPGCVATHTNTISNNLVKDIKFLTGKCCFRRLGSIATKTAARGCCEMFLNSSKKVCLVNKSITHSSHTMWHVSCFWTLSQWVCSGFLGCTYPCCCPTHMCQAVSVTHCLLGDHSDFPQCSVLSSRSYIYLSL